MRRKSVGAETGTVGSIEWCIVGHGNTVISILRNLMFLKVISLKSKKPHLFFSFSFPTRQILENHCNGFQNNAFSGFTYPICSPVRHKLVRAKLGIMAQGQPLIQHPEAVFKVTGIAQGLNNDMIILSTMGIEPMTFQIQPPTAASNCESPAEPHNGNTQYGVNAYKGQP